MSTIAAMGLGTSTGNSNHKMKANVLSVSGQQQ